MDEYPKRQKFFACRVIRLLGKTCAAQEIGAMGFTLVTVIAMTEDAAGYRRPVTWFDGQLMPIIGAENQKQLQRARTKAVESGWLHYEHGQKGVPGRYWVTIPNLATGLDDAPTDEGHDVSVDDPKTPMSTDRPRTVLGLSSDCPQIVLGSSSDCPPFLPIPIPIPIPRKEAAAPLAVSDGDLTVAWNRAIGLQPIKRFTSKRKTALRVRCGDPHFVEHWQAAIERISGSTFCTGGGSTGWIADVDWFLKPDTVTKILEGKYDDRTNGEHRGGAGGRGQSAEQQRFAASLDAIERFARSDETGLRAGDGAPVCLEANGGLH